MITLITPTSSQPRFHKRALALLDGQLEPVVFSFKRSYYNVNEFHQDVPVTELAHMEDGKYWLRFKKLFSAVRILSRHRKLSGSKIAYAFSIDCALIAILSGFKEIIYEVGDIRSSSKVTRMLEEYIFNKSKLICVTSTAFKEYFAKLYSADRNKIIVVDNKITTTPNREVSASDKLRIGIVGLLRYRTPLEFICRFAEETPQVKLVVYGDGPCKSLFADKQDIAFYGPFKNPDDLDKIYSSIDANYVVYDNSSENVRLAIPNKLFESMGYKVPMIVAENTYLGEQVAHYNIGNSVSISSYEAFKQDMTRFIEQHATYAESFNNIGPQDYMDDSDKVLNAKIKEVWC